MELGMIGLGRMGANMAQRLMRAGHSVIGYVRRTEKLDLSENSKARLFKAFRQNFDIFVKTES